LKLIYMSSKIYVEVIRMKVVIIGGVAVGASVATNLRRMNEEIEIVILEKGKYISYANCGLPYYIGGVIKEKSALEVVTKEQMAHKFNVDVRILNEVIDIDVEKKMVKVLNRETGSEYEESFDKLVVSPGANPIVPNIEGKDLENVFTLRTIPDTYAIKDYADREDVKSALVIGAGYIGIEVAENLRHQGLNVTIVEKAESILGVFDEDISVFAKNELVKNGIDILTEAEVSKIESDRALLSNGLEVKADMVIMAIGVKPEVGFLKGKIEIGNTGGILVDKNLKTSNEDIYAGGDAIETRHFITGEKSLIPLAGPANKHGKIIAQNILGSDAEYKGSLGSSVLKVFNYTLASVGVNEKTLKRLGVKYNVVLSHLKSHAGYYPGASPVHLKLIFDDNGKILGAQAAGIDMVEKRIDVIATAIKLGAKVSDLEELELTYAPPYSSAKDPVNLAGSMANNVVEGELKTINVSELTDEYVIVDVREKMELMFGMIDGAMHVPLSEFRNRFNEIPKDKKVVLYCAIGGRSYTAYRILKNNGYESIFNLNGGYLTYTLIKN
jgi:NADPH-dependent 2,4-dienoyl-CoA reductase/sulfur reductase-like enzyme/rhodanese-related sulfurtransferase